MRSCSLPSGSSPTQEKTFLTPPTKALSFLISEGSSQPPGSLNTTIWPRCGVQPNHGVSLFTSTRSPGSMVCCMDCDGMK